MNGGHELTQLYNNLATIWGSLMIKISMQDLYLNTEPVLLFYEG